MHLRANEVMRDLCSGGPLVDMAGELSPQALGVLAEVLLTERVVAVLDEKVIAEKHALGAGPDSQQKAGLDQVDLAEAGQMAVAEVPPGTENQPPGTQMGTNAPTLSEIADLTARLRDLSGRTAEEVPQDELDAFCADRDALLDRVENPDQHEPIPAEGHRELRRQGAATFALDTGYRNVSPGREVL